MQRACCAFVAAVLAGCGGGSSNGPGALWAVPSATTPDTPPTPPAGPAPEAPAPVKKAMLIGISGVQLSSLQALVQQGKAPNFAGFTLMPAYTGGIVGSAGQQPTLSEPGWATVLTGTWANRHAVQDNAATQLAAPSVFALLSQDAVPRHAAASVTRQEPLAALLASESARGAIERLSLCADDACVIDSTTASIGAGTADLVVANLSDAGAVVRTKGIGPEYDGALQAADAALGKIASAVAQRRQAHPEEDWLLVLTTDHGPAVDGFSDGLQLLANKTAFIGLNKPGNAAFTPTDASSQAPTSLDALYRFASAADIAPTLLSYLGVAPAGQGVGFDGGPLIGAAGVRQLSASVGPDGASVKLAWTRIDATPASIQLYRNGRLLQTLSGDTVQFVDRDAQGWIEHQQNTLDYVVTANGVAVATQVQLFYVKPVALPASLKAGLLHLFSFNQGLGDAAGAAGLAPFVAGKTPVFAADGIDESAALTIDTAVTGFRLADDVTAANDRFTLGFWFRSNGTQSDSPLFGNKNWHSGKNPGLVLAVDNAGIKLNIGDGTNRADTAFVSFAAKQWVHVSVTVDKTNQKATLTVEDATHGAQIVSLDWKSVAAAQIAGLGTFGLGDDARGLYYTADGAPGIQAYDDVAMWNRMLTQDEIHALFASKRSITSLP
ncbi:Concanavalin A-like lectin/glucanases superfamily protein [Variovorax sp. 770b2]|nr:Concanavalin A-like lectin/glucanases superfamily protein [Variovorax sp. 770b2]